MDCDLAETLSSYPAIDEQRAAIYGAKGDHAKAIALYQSLISRGNASEALEYFNLAVSADGTDGFAYHDEAEALQKVGRPSAAIAPALRASELLLTANPTEAMESKRLATQLMRMRRRDLIVANARRAGTLIVGVASMLVVAGTIEAFISPRRLPASERIAVGVVTAVALILYFTGAGREGHASKEG